MQCRPHVIMQSSLQVDKDQRQAVVGHGGRTVGGQVSRFAVLPYPVALDGVGDVIRAATR